MQPFGLPDAGTPSVAALNGVYVVGDSLGLSVINLVQCLVQGDGGQAVGKSPQRTRRP